MVKTGKLDEAFWIRPAGGAPIEVIFIDDDEKEVDNDDHASTSFQTLKKRKLNSDTPDTTPSKPPGTRDVRTPSNVKPKKPAPLYGEKATKFNLDAVAAHLKEVSTSNFPNQLQPKVLDNMIRETIKHWNEPLEEFFAKL